MKMLRYISFLLTLTLFSFVTASQEASTQALSNIELSYTYSTGNAVTLTIKGGKLGYLWTAGTNKGNGVKDLHYNSWKIANSIYLVSWHDPENKNFVSLTFNLNTMKEYGTALIAYGTPNEVTLFDEARINTVKWLE